MRDAGRIELGSCRWERKLQLYEQPDAAIRLGAPLFRNAARKALDQNGRRG
jgi:hypothetical protein